MTQTVANARRCLALGKGETDMGGGWESHDIQDGLDILDLSMYEDESFDEVYGSHVLEHVPYEKSQGVIREVYRILKAGGRCRIAVPDLDKWVKGYTEDEEWAVGQVLFGGHMGEHDSHQGWFTKSTLTEMYTNVGFVAIEPFTPEFPDTSNHPVSLNLEAIKPGNTIAMGKWASKCCLVMTRPRLMFSDCADSISRLVAKYPMMSSRFSGAFWDQGMEKAVDMGIKSGAEWLVCVDYDTVFSPSDFEKMVTILDACPDIDALAPMQCMRGNDLVLFGHDGPIRWDDTRGPVMEVTTAHFGFTLIRAEAVRRMPRPLFQSQPDDEGRWGEGRTDADIYFWRQFTKAGGKVCMSPRVPVGHLQLLATWPDENFQPQVQHLQDYNDNGPPLCARRWAAPWMSQYERAKNGTE